VPAGIYRVVLNIDGQELTQTIRVDADPTMPAGTASQDDPVSGDDDYDDTTGPIGPIR